MPDIIVCAGTSTPLASHIGEFLDLPIHLVDRPSEADWLDISFEKSDPIPGQAILFADSTLCSEDEGIATAYPPPSIDVDKRRRVVSASFERALVACGTEPIARLHIPTPPGYIETFRDMDAATEDSFKALLSAVNDPGASPLFLAVPLYRSGAVLALADRVALRYAMHVKNHVGIVVIPEAGYGHGSVKLTRPSRSSVASGYGSALIIANGPIETSDCVRYVSEIGATPLGIVGTKRYRDEILFFSSAAIDTRFDRHMKQSFRQHW